MTVFIKNKEPGYCALITFWQFVKATGMYYNEFMNEMGLTHKNGKIIQPIWDSIFTGEAKFDELASKFFTPMPGGKSLLDYVDSFLKIIYEAQTGIKVDPLLNSVKNYHRDITEWDNNKILDTYNNFSLRKPEVPFITELFTFNKDDFQLPEHVYITTMERKVPGGPFTIKEYDSNRDGAMECVSNTPYCPLIYSSLDYDNVSEIQKAGNLRTTK